MAWIDKSRVIATFAVVFLHVAAYVVVGSNLGSQSWWFGNIYDSFVRWCVPVFVMISGALLLHPDKMESMETFFKKRVSKIFIPILFWSVFFLLWNLLNLNGTGKELKFLDLLKKLVSGRPHYHMWFLYMIITLYLFTPYFRKIIVNSTRREIKILVVFGFLIAALNAAISINYFCADSKLFINFFLPYIPYYFLGYLISTDNRDLSNTALWGVFIISASLTALGCYVFAVHSTLEKGVYFYNNLSITVIPMSVSIMYLLKSWKKPIISEKFTRAISLLTLGVYVIHPIILETISNLGFNPLNFNPAVSIPIIVIIVFSSS